ncbi:MAG: hypothetical protein JWO38_1173 [Gemmataceae bacterium]|nr:hypothetical protein [Gemmataceae bacterium]
MNDARVVGDVFRISPGARVVTREEVTGPFEVQAVARTTRNNIRLCGPSGSGVIFNWEGNQRELRVNRPNGVNGRLESGTVATAPVTPLTPDTWYTLRWRVTKTQIDVWVDDACVFSEKGVYDLSASYPVQVRAMDSVVELKSLSARSLQ